MRGKKKWAAIALVASIIVATTAYIRPDLHGQRLRVKTPGGDSLSILEYHFQPGSVRYELYGSGGWLFRLLPSQWTRKLGVTRTLTFARFSTNEAGLSIAFLPSLKARHSGLRLIVSDEHGNEYDEGVHDFGWRQFWVKEVRAFPRRGKQVQLRIATPTTNLFPALIIPNPDPGPHPIWNPNALPVAATNENLEAKLVAFRCTQHGHSTNAARGISPKTELTFQVFDGKNHTSDWQLMSLSFSDATGNHWQPWRFDDWIRIEGDDLHATVIGALWAGENAWKIGLELKKITGFGAGEIIRFENVPIPGTYEIVEPNLVASSNGINVPIFAVIGKSVDGEQIYRWNPERIPNSMTVLISGNVIKDGHRLVFLKATDDKGKNVPLVKTLGEARQLSGQQFAPYSLNFRPEDDAGSLTVVLGVAKTKLFEFVAKPEIVAGR